jgi:negative regulator of sigma E activity
MNDDDAFARAEAASAFLDGEIDAAERASVAADPDAMALVDSFAKVRDALGAVEPAPDNVRADAMSAALAEFDVRQRIRTAPVTAIVLKPRWQRAYPIFRGAAAAAVIAVVVFAVANGTKGSDSKSSSEGTQPPAAAQQRTEAATGAAPAATAAPSATTPAGAADSSNQKLAAPVPVVNTPDDLRRFAAGFDFAASTSTGPSSAAGAAPGATALVPTPEAPPATCLTPTDTYLGTVSVLGSPAFAVRDDSTGLLRAVDPIDCRVLFTVPSSP